MSSSILILRKSTLSLIKQSRGIKWFAKPQNYMAQNFPKQDEDCKQLKLEVPDLKSTMNKYLRSLRPILNESDFRRTQLIVKDFLDINNPFNGHRLQNALRSKAECIENWASDIYADEYYYKVNLPLPIYSNPAKLMKKQNFTNENDYLKYVTLFINSVLDFKFKIDSNTLEADKSTGYDKTQELCMDQYKKIFKSYRRPYPGKDKFLIYENDFSKEHIIIISNNQFFKINLIVDSQLINELDLFYQLKYIRQESKKNQEHQVGLLTSLPRDEWAVIRNDLSKDHVNSKSFECIEKSAFIICLDNQVDSNIFKNEDIKNGNQILNGCGSLFNSGNRWFDKTLQFVISEDGVSGLVREHSPSEGPITVNLINHVYNYLQNSKSIDFSEVYPFSKPQKLNWTDSEYLNSKIKYASQKFNNLIDDFELNVFCYEKFGRSFPKKLNLSPDSFLQVALQFAFFKINNVLPVHASIGSLRRFDKGRVDYIRGSNNDLMRFCMAMIDIHSSKGKKFFLLKQAVDMQTKIMMDTIHGNGYDCHLTALKSIAEKKDENLPALFKDEVFDFNNRIQLLASQVTTEFEGTFSCFGPNVLGGSTSTYNYKPDNILFTIGGLKSCSLNSASDLTYAFSKSLDEIFALVNN